jgi:hypothetical protein
MFLGARSVSWTRHVSAAKELSNKMFMSAHVNDIRLEPLYSSKKCLKKSLLKKFKKITNCRRGGREGMGGWRIVIPMPEAINFVDGRRQKLTT